jgi:hypothetical protein
MVIPEKMKDTVSGHQSNLVLKGNAELDSLATDVVGRNDDVPEEAGRSVDDEWRW